MFFAYRSVPQVAAQDKLSGKSQTITITSDKGRLSEKDIERMIKEAEENAETDRVTKENVEARNHFEAYLYGMRSTVQDLLKGKLAEDDKETILKAVTESLSWLDNHTDASKEEFDEKRREVEAVASPIITQAYKSTGGVPPSGGEGEGGHNPDEPIDAEEVHEGPSVEEVD